MTEAKSVWTLFKGWRGSPKLLAHVANVCVGEMSGGGEVEPESEIAVWVDQDVERFASSADFRDGVTYDALKRFDCLSLEARAADGSASVTIDIARKQHPKRSWLKGVVLLQVATQPGSEIQADELHRRVFTALSRGTKGENQGEIELEGDSPEEVVQAWKAKLRRSRLLAIPVLALIIGFVALTILVGPIAGFKRIHPDWFPFLLGGVMGAILSTTFILLNPSFEVSEQTRANRVVRILYRGVGPVLGAVAGVVLKVVAG